MSTFLFYKNVDISVIKMSTFIIFAILGTELGGRGQEFGHERVSESVSEADSDTSFFETSDTDSVTKKLNVHRPLGPALFGNSQLGNNLLRIN